MRSLLAGGLLAGTVVFPGATRPAMAVPATGAGRVVVVGAGLAGLVAAYELEQLGWQVTVLEARDRIGGRVYTCRQGFLEGQYAEAGGEYIDGLTVHSQMHRYIQQFGLELAAVTGATELGGTYYLEQQRLPLTERAIAITFGPQVAADLDRFWDQLALLASPITDFDHIGTNPGSAALDQRTVAQWTDDLKLHPVARQLLDQYLRGETDEPSRLSLLFLAQQAALYAKVPDRQLELYRIAGGNEQLPLALARHLQTPVQTRCPVQRICQTAQGVTVDHAQGQLEADYVVVAAPLPALRSVSFEPNLPGVLRDAIASLNYGTHVKVMVQYRQRLWRQRYGVSGRTLTDLPLGFAIEATAQQPGTGGILTAYVSGQYGQQLLALPPDQQIASVIDQLEQIYPGSRALVATAQTRAWPLDPYSGGSYSNYGPGQLTAYWEALRRPQGRLYFAGEHTDRFIGYMEGAVRSGQRIAWGDQTGAHPLGMA